MPVIYANQAEAMQSLTADNEIQLRKIIGDLNEILNSAHIALVQAMQLKTLAKSFADTVPAYGSLVKAVQDYPRGE